MFREDNGRGGGRRPSRNVLGLPLEPCSHAPLTGFFRNGCCDTSREDIGSHTVCIVSTEEFLAFSKAIGNDLSTPMPQYGFPGLEAGRPLVPLRAALAGGVRGRQDAACGAAGDA